jgi:hypothetical protein
MQALIRARLVWLVAFGLVAGASSMRAEEGFWPFSSVPREQIKQAYGFDVTDAWLTHLQLASVRFGGASGSFVSPDGLVLTNHHVGLGTLAKLSTAERDLVAHGFLAATRAEELKAPDLELLVLQSIEDVTARVNAAVKPGTSPAEAFVARKAAIAAIEKTSTEATGLRSDVVTLYQGGQYHLYRYKKYTDVRLVFAPEYEIAFFGGDPDNFTYPRYCLDVTLFRVYENDRPARIEHFLKWSPKGAREGELVFTSGHPGGTERLYTVAHLQDLRDRSLPFALRYLDRRRDSRLRYAARGAEQERQVKQDVFGIDNALKSIRGQLAGLQDEGLMAQKRSAEETLRRRVTADAALQTQYAAGWDQIARARAALPAFAIEHAMIEGAVGLDTRLFTMARHLVRLAAERSKPDTARLPEYTEARLASLERQLYSPAPLYIEAEKATLAASLVFLRDELGADHLLVKAALAGKTPENRAAELLDGTKLGDVAARKAVAAAGAAGIAASTDPLIVLAREIDPGARALRQRHEDEVVSVERDAYAKIAQAVFATRGTSAYPDGTSTLRLSYGQVKGYASGGRAIQPFTDFAGLFARQEQFGARPPYDAPQRWDDRRSALDPATPFNLVTTNDIVGGNSGSPVVDAGGEIVGLVFDGNIESLPGYFIYDGTVNRTVAVDSRAIVEALVKVYDDRALADEILGHVPAMAPTGQ